MSEAKRPRRLFVETIGAEGEEQSLPAIAAQHVRVLRLGQGDPVELFDGRGQCAAARLLAGGRELTVRVGAHRQLPPPVARLTLVACLPKGNKLDTAVRMLTELGVSELRLALSERTVPSSGDSATRIARWERIAREACAQSGQPRALQIAPPRPLLEVATEAPAGAEQLLFWEHARQPLGALGAGSRGEQATEVWALVGPEGGLTSAEAAALQQHGYRGCGLGESILRAETALIAVSTLLLDRMGRLS